MPSGGARKGAGRKSQPYGKKVTLALRIRPDLREQLNKVAEDKKTTLSELIEAALIYRFGLPARQKTDKDN